MFTRRLGHQIAGAVEAAKIALSDQQAAAVHLPLDPGIDITLQRTDVDRAIHEDTTRILAAIDRCCQMAGVASAAIQSVFLTGGSTGIPAVRRRILAHLPNAVPVAGDMFGSVGLGLAIDATRRF